ncbi:sensor histidine kinase [Bacteroides xylanisolvens]|uniref:Histidine kinase n=1 Tax=Bacteroides intestinalis TaxID=329854 RepID=A0AB37M5V6_9BACE|nr:histidine kinase [Bacteroides xylanisolvens]RHN02339.1 histidine kinase [Bacteroides intestinalis]
MLRTTKNELLIGFTISVILSLFANFALIMQHYELVTNSPAGDVALKQGKIELWFPLLWLFFFSFVLFILCRWIYRLGIRRFHKEVKTLGLATGICLLVACGLYKAFPFIRKSVMTQIHSDSFCVTEQAVSLSRFWTSTTPAIEKKDTLANTSPDRVHRGVIGAMTVTSNSYPLIIEHIFILLTVLLTMLLLHLFDKKQEMKLEYEKIKVKQLQSSYNALMGQINPHFFFNSLNGLNSLIRAGEQEKTLEYLEGLSNVFRYILQSNHKTLVSLDEELQFVKAYTYLLGVRYEHKLFFSIQVEETYLRKKLPILSLLPLIENAVKHNVISKRHPLQIQIYTKSDNWLVILNSIRPKMEETVGHGIGLKNLRERYRMLTGRNIQIANANGCFEVFLPLLNEVE